MSRWALLRDKLDSSGARLLALLNERPDDATLAQWFKELYELEKKHDVTLWHPLQIVVSGLVSEGVREGKSADSHTPAHPLTHLPVLPERLGLNLPVDNVEQRDRLLRAWHVRRWLVTMMSTAGHSQDTGITLADIALRLQQEGLAPNVVFYLIQNKYDSADHNRPSQLAYDKGELGQRNKLARLLMEVAPGSRAYSLNDWTPFGFKAGGLVGMDLVHEESLKLTTCSSWTATPPCTTSTLGDVTLAERSRRRDRRPAAAHQHAHAARPRIAVGRGRPRAMLRGFRSWAGGPTKRSAPAGAACAVFTTSATRARRSNMPKMPLTSRMKRGTPFGDRFEAIGFGPRSAFRRHLGRDASGAQRHRARPGAKFEHSRRCGTRSGDVEPRRMVLRVLALVNDYLQMMQTSHAAHQRRRPAERVRERTRANNAATTSARRSRCSTSC